MAGRWRSRTFLILGLPVIALGIGLFIWEGTQPADLELVSAPLLLLGLFLLFEAYISWRRQRLAGDNPK